MPLLSEFLVQVATIIILTVYALKPVSEGHWLPFAHNNYAVLLLVSLFSVYGATRILLETESPQSAVPGFIVVIFVFLEVLKRGKYYPGECLCHFLTLAMPAAVLATFIAAKGFVSLAKRAQELPLDREVQYYHILLMGTSSWRSFLLFTIVGFPVLKIPKLGWIIIGLKICLLWVLLEASGTKVTTSPWGVLDEILLDKNSLLYVIFGLITFAMVMDQIASNFVNDIEETDTLNGTNTQRKSAKDVFEDFKKSLSGNPIELNASEDSSSSTTRSSSISTGDIRNSAAADHDENTVDEPGDVV